MWKIHEPPPFNLIVLEAKPSIFPKSSAFPHLGKSLGCHYWMHIGATIGCIQWKECPFNTWNLSVLKMGSWCSGFANRSFGFAQKFVASMRRIDSIDVSRKESKQVVCHLKLNHHCHFPDFTWLLSIHVQMHRFVFCGTWAQVPQDKKCRKPWWKMHKTKPNRWNSLV